MDNPRRAVFVLLAISIAFAVITGIMAYNTHVPARIASTGWKTNMPIRPLHVDGDVIDVGNKVLFIAWVGTNVYSKTFSIDSIVDRFLSELKAGDAYLIRNGVSISGTQTLFIKGNIKYGIVPDLSESDIQKIKSNIGNKVVVLSLYGSVAILPNSTVTIAYLDYDARATVQVDSTTAIIRITVNGTAYVLGGAVKHFVYYKSDLYNLPVIDKKAFSYTKQYIIRGKLYSLPDRNYTLLVPEQLSANITYMNMLVKTAEELRHIGLNVTVKVIPPNSTGYAGYIVLFTRNDNIRITYDNTTRVKIILARNPEEAVSKLVPLPGPLSWLDITNKLHHSVGEVFVGELQGRYVYIVP